MKLIFSFDIKESIQSKILYIYTYIHIYKINMNFSTLNFIKKVQL